MDMALISLRLNAAHADINHWEAEDLKPHAWIKLGDLCPAPRDLQ